MGDARAKNYPAGMAACTADIGEPTPYGGTLCTLAQMQEMYAAGWEVYGHHTAKMTEFTEADQVVIHRGAKAFLSTNGFLRGDRIWVWPGGAHNATVEAIARRYWQTLRRVGTFTVMGTPHVYDPLDPPIEYVTASKSLAVMTDRIDRIAISGGHITFVFHNIGTTKVFAEDWLVSDFQALLNYIESKGVPVVPLSEVWTV